MRFATLVPKRPFQEGRFLTVSHSFFTSMLIASKYWRLPILPSRANRSVPKPKAESTNLLGTNVTFINFTYIVWIRLSFVLPWEIMPFRKFSFKGRWYPLPNNILDDTFVVTSSTHNWIVCQGGYDPVKTNVQHAVKVLNTLVLWPSQWIEHRSIYFSSAWHDR